MASDRNDGRTDPRDRDTSERAREIPLGFESIATARALTYIDRRMEESPRSRSEVVDVLRGASLAALFALPQGKSRLGLLLSHFLLKTMDRGMERLTSDLLEQGWTPTSGACLTASPARVLDEPVPQPGPAGGSGDRPVQDRREDRPGGGIPKP